MKTIAVTLGVGKAHGQFARWSARLVEHYLKLETRIVDDEYLPYALPNVPHPKNIWTLKFSLFDIFPDADRIMYFDCDWRPVRPFNLDDYCADHTKFYVVPDRGEWSEEVAEVAKSYGIDPTKYFNAGWFVAHRTHQPLFQKCKEKYHSLSERWGDQCILNQVLKDHVTHMPRKLNMMDFGTVPPAEVLGYHNGVSILVAAKKIRDYDWNATPGVVPDTVIAQQKHYADLRGLDYSHHWVTACDHIIDVYQCAKDYAGQNALEVGSFKGHGTYALYLAGLNVRACDNSEEHLVERRRLCPAATFMTVTGEQELTRPEKYAVIFHDSFHGETVVPEIVRFWEEKLLPGGLLIVHDTDSFNLDNFVQKLGNPLYKNTLDNRKRGLGFFWKPA